MHELSIALSLVDVALDELVRQGQGRVGSLQVKIGLLSGVVPAALVSAWGVATKRTSLAGSVLEIHEVPITVVCPTCDAVRPVVSPQAMRCAVCGTPSGQIVTGRELELVSMQLLDLSQTESSVADGADASSRSG